MSAATPIDSFLSEITRPSAAAEWLASDHVTAICERWRREWDEEERQRQTDAGVKFASLY